MHISDILDETELTDLLAKGLVNQAHHPKYGYTIYNYSKTAPYTFRGRGNWPYTATLCRGLIVDEDGRILARPFPKFFNAEEHPRSDLMWSKNFAVTDKMDGSLGIMYPLPVDASNTVNLDYVYIRRYAIATRGSFTSDQAIRANEILDQKYGHIVHNLELFDTGHIDGDGFTLLFEIIYPQNRIVVDYSGMEDLVLLALIDNRTGLDVSIGDNQPWPVVKSYDTTAKPRDVIKAIGLPEDGSAEGVVLRFDYPKGYHTRVKVKVEEYIRLHAIVTNVSNVVVWEYLKAGKDFAELIERVPDEFYKWLTKTKLELLEQHQKIVQDVEIDFKYIMDSNPSFPDDPRERRKTFAQFIKDHPRKHLLFLRFDNRADAIQEAVWDMIRPTFSKPFSHDIDA